MTSKYKYSFSERLKMVSQQKSHEDKIKNIQLLKDNNFLSIMDYWLDPTIEFLDKDDVVEYTPCKELGTNLGPRFDQESRNFHIFTNKTKYPNMTKQKRLSLFIDILSNIHPEDAELLNNLRKNKKLPHKLKPIWFIEAFPEKKEWMNG
jgi:hypothetical protein